MALISVFAHHKVAANLLMALMIIGGIYALSKLNIQFFPNFDLDIVSVRVVWSGASAEDIENGITIPLEQLLKTVDNLHKMTSTSAQNMASIQLEFESGSNMIEALNQVKQKVDEFRNLPLEAEKPVVEHIIFYESVAKIQISGDLDTREMRVLANHFERDLIRRGIDKVDISGLPDQEIAIEIPTTALQQLQLHLDDIATRIRATSQDQPLGSFASTDIGKELRVLDQKREVADFADILIKTGAHESIRLGDIARIEKREKKEGLTRTVKGKRVVELALKRSKQGNSLQAAKILYDWLNEVKPTLPHTVKLTVYDESWQLIRDRIRLLLNNGISGLILVVLILYAFLNARVAFWVALGIPVSFMATLAILYAVGGSINMLSLFALIMALGIIVDDAIVVGEDALAHYQAGETPLLAAEGGARRMFLPVLASSLTTVAAFLPLMLISGVMGKILFDIPLIIVCVIIASLIESFFVLPGHLRHSFRHMRRDSERPDSVRAILDTRFEQFRDQVFQPAIRLALRYRLISLSLALSLLILCVGLLISEKIGYRFFPSPESQIIYANVNFISGTSREITDQYLQKMENALYQTEQQLGGGLIENAIVVHGSSFTGGRTSKRGDQLGAIYLQLIDPDKRAVRNETFIREWKKNIPPQAGMESLSISARKVGPKGSDITIRLRGADNRVLKQAANELGASLKQIKGVYSVDNDMPYGKQQIVFSLTARGLAMGLDMQNLARQLRTAFAGNLVQIYQQGVDEIEVRVMLPQAERDYMRVLNHFYVSVPVADNTVTNNTFVNTRQNSAPVINQSTQSLPTTRFVPLSTIANWREQHGFEVVRHADGELAIEVLAEVDSKQNSVNAILKQLEQGALKTLSHKYGIMYSFEGRSADEKDTRKDMQYGVIIGLVLIYMVLVWIFQSYGQPLIVMSIIPFGLVGAISGHWFMGIDMTLLSLFGFFGLSGIVVNDSIILVSFYQHQRRAGMAVTEALINAARMRLRAVLLTSLTTIAGLTPLLFETSLQAQFLIPMATSIAFGLMFSTITVLFIVPVLLSLYESMLTFFRGSVNDQLDALA